MKTKHPLLGLVVFSILIHQSLNAEVLHWPQVCPQSEIVIKNLSSEPANLWLQKFDKVLIRESEIELEPKSEIKLKLESIENNERYSLLNLNSPQTIEAVNICNSDHYKANTLEGGLLTFKKSNLPTDKFWLENLYVGENQFEIEYLDSKLKVLSNSKFILENAEKKTLSTESAPSNWHYVRIQSSHKSVSYQLSSSGMIEPIKVAPQKKVVEKSYYFLVGSRYSNNDNFIVKISNPNMVEQARDLILHPEKEKMLFARIQKDHQGFNRNWSKTEKSMWSWSTTEVTGFGELGSISCNGTPQQLEDRVDFWVQDVGQICFWNYRVKKELTPQQVADGL